jgi:ergosteryl-3beta-O-L-aspartate synthase
MVRWAEHLHREAIVLVQGVLQKPQAKQEEVKGASIHELEVKIQKVRTKF